MSRQDLVDSLGTIARSGTAKFTAALKVQANRMK
jgi:HSP90 family molecular chaperone